MRFDASVTTASAQGRRVQRTPVARRIVGLTSPSQPPRGALENVAGLLLARAAPFDQPGQALMCVQWELPAPGKSPFVGYLDPPAGTAGRRLGGIHAQLRRLAAQCRPPQALLEALDLVAARPAASELELRCALAEAGLANGMAGPLLLIELARLWQVPIPEALDPPADVRNEVAVLARRARAAGVLPATPVPAGQMPLLRAAQVRGAGAWLVAVDDWTSQLARPVRRQLAAVGPLTAEVLVEGACRERPGLAGLAVPALLVWAREQSDLTVEGNSIALSADRQRWLRATDPPVLRLFADVAAGVPRSAILSALVEHGSGLPSAEVWLVRCAWLRRADGHCGRYTLAGWSVGSPSGDVRTLPSSVG